MQAHLGTIVCKFGVDPAICLVEAIFVPEQKCPYHVTFDLDLEHTLDAGPSGDHRVQVWSRSSHLSVEEAICAKSLQTDGRRTPHDHISSFLGMS